MDYRIEQLRYLLREDPSSRIFFQLGELLRREGDAAEAVGILKTGLERHPRYVAAWVSLGRTYRDLDALAEAENALETALEIDRENPVAARLLGETAAEREDWLGAVKALKLTRALAGGDAELDAEIARVEERLDEDGRLERVAAGPRRVEPPARCLEVVSFSGDDPFSSSSEETAADVVASDVFDLAEDSPDREAEEVPEDHESPSGPEEVSAVADEEPPVADEEISEEPVAAELSGFVDTESVEAGGDDQPPEDTVVETAESGADSALSIDEVSVGAWSSTMAAAGVSGDEAWREPTDDFRLRDDEALSGGPWSEPIPILETSATDVDIGAPDEPEAGDLAADEPLPAEGGAEFEESVADEADEEPATGVADDGSPADVKIFDSIEATHPIVIERRREDAEKALLAETADAAGEEPEEEFPAASDDEVLPGEDRGSETIEVTRPIAIDPQSVDVHPSPSDEVQDDDDPSGEMAEDEQSGDETVVGGARHELEHGVPLPTMTLAKLAFQQNDRPLAMATLESLLDRDPGNAEAVAMLDELRAQDELAANEKLRAAHATTKIAALQGWLDAVRLAAERRVQ